MQDRIIEGYRLSPLQKNLWLLQQVEQRLPYRASCAVLIDGHLNTEAFQAALERVVNRYEILRTTYRCLPGMTIPLQVITDNGMPPAQDSDLSALDPRQQEGKVAAFFQETGQLPVDFEHGPLLRMSLAHLSPNKRMLLVMLPALCADLATLRNLVREISRSYAACLRGEDLADELMQYADISEWQNELLESKDTEKGREYWCKQDFSTLRVLKLPFENRPGEEPGFEAAFLALEIKPEIGRKIAAFVRQHDTSTSVFLLSCWQILLWRLTGQPDMIVGAAYDGRIHKELEETLGLLARFLPLRCHLDESFRFSDILAQTKAAANEIREWQEYFALEDVSGLARNSSELIFFPFEFTFEEQAATYSVSGASFSISTEYVCIDRFKMKLSCVLRDDSLDTEFHYDTNLYEADDIKRLAGQFHALLESAVNQPEVPIGELNILTDAEKHQLLSEFNDTKSDYPRGKCIHQLFEEQVERTPNNVAVVYEDQQLTYRELNSRANQLARYLKRIGVQPETLVALCVERSLEMIVGLLGVLKAGGAYVPLDPVLPKDRLAFMLEDSRVSVLLTQECLLDKLPAHTAQVICLDRNWQEIAEESNDNAHAGTRPDNAVYVLYTSGSTGKPKGVVVEHRQLLNYVNGILPRLDLPKGASFATVTTIAADLGNTAIFPSLCTGGCLHVLSQERASSPDALGDYFTSHAIDCLKIVPSYLEILLTGDRPAQVLPRRRLILGGEACSWALIEKVQVLSPNCVILNHYGPTETTIGATTYLVPKNLGKDRPATPPIGRPIANTETYVLDSHLQPVPIWVAGELYIGGGGLARGYYNHPDLSAEKFILNPLSNEPGARLYKTGDLVRYLPGGDIAFIGRIDNQVKIRGFRVEPGEIEAVLGQHHGVREAIVIAREDGTGDKKLVGYVVPHREQSLATSDLRNFLKSKLPDYMVPSAFVFLDTLPLTPNGKVDRKALPEPNQSRPELEENYVAPRTLVEELLAEIWAGLLKIDQVGIHDNFFDLGGHSLLATRVVSQIRRTLQVELPLRALFEKPTVEQLAVLITQSQAKRAEQDDLARILTEVEALSDDETERLLAHESP